MDLIVGIKKEDLLQMLPSIYHNAIISELWIDGDKAFILTYEVNSRYNPPDNIDLYIYTFKHNGHYWELITRK